jgi:hypothetical protein
MSFLDSIKGFTDSIKIYENVGTKGSPDSEVDDALNLIASKIGGSEKDDTASQASMHAIKQALDKIPSELISAGNDDPRIQKIFFHMSDPIKAEFAKEYAEEEAKQLEELIKKQNPKDGINKMVNHDNEFTASFNQAATMINRLEKMYKIYKENIEKIKLDKENYVLGSLRNVGAELDLGDDKQGRIGKIGGVDQSIDNGKFELLTKEGTKILPKSEVSTVLKKVKSEKDRVSGKNVKKMQTIVDTSSKSIKNWYEWASNTFKNVVKNIESTDDDLEAASKIDSVESFSSNASGVVFNLVFNYEGKETTAGEKLQEKKKEIEKKEPKPKIKRKRGLYRKLREALASAMLPAFTGTEIKREGDYYKIFKTLYKQRPDWMDDILMNNVFSGDPKHYGQFKKEMNRESVTEGTQLDYLNASEAWLNKFIESDYMGEFSQRETDNSKSTIASLVLQKKTDIKNFYLSRGFNIGNFASVQINPEIELPLYKKVKLAISKEDRREENTLANVAKGAKNILSALIPSANLDSTYDAAAAQRNYEQNKAIFKGLNTIVKGFVGAAGGKEAARKYEKGMKKLTNNPVSKAVGLTTADESEPIKEDMLGPMDSPSFTMTNPEAPGGGNQTPLSVPSGMDKFALAGPTGGDLTKTKKKKSGKRKKKKEDPSTSNKVLTFADFIKNKS